MIAPAPIGAVATALVGSPTQVVCRPTRMMEKNEQGYVLFRGAIPDHTIFLDQGVCQRLSNPLKGFDALDFLAFEHEAMHIVLQSTDECVVERAALANIWQIVKRFALPANLAKWELDNAAAADARLPAQYHEGC